MNGCNNCSKCRDIKRECPWGGTYHHKGESGEHIGICNAYKQETNADQIRGMSDEELADYLMDVSMGLLIDKGIMNVKDWLRQPWEGNA